MNDDVHSAGPRRQLNLFDSTCIIVGIIIGVGIYETTPMIARAVASPSALIGVWLLGVAISLVGALCLTELATSYPREGGHYVFLRHAFGPRLGFLFAWASFWIVRPGSVGMLAFVFARYASTFVSLGDQQTTFVTLAVGSIALLTVTNILGVRTGKWSQNILASLKVAGLLAIAAVALLPMSGPSPAAAVNSASGLGDLRLALILVLFTYGGWDELAYVAAEVRDPRRNVIRALVLGLAVVAGVYVLINLAFLHLLGLAGMQQSQAVAADAVGARLGPWSARFMSLLICISCLGAINGLIFTGARIYYALGADNRWLSFLGDWHPRLGTPARSLAVQGAMAMLLVLAVASPRGFDRLLIFTAPVFWFFFFFVGLSLFVLRRRSPEVAQPFRVPLYPLTPILFCLATLFMLYSGTTYAWSERSYEALWAVGILLVGAAVSLWAAGATTAEKDRVG